MLILSRYPKDKIFIYDKSNPEKPIATIHIVSVGSSSPDKRHNSESCVEFGIEADDHIGIDREEVYYSKLGFDTPNPVNCYG